MRMALRKRIERRRKRIKSSAGMAYDNISAVGYIVRLKSMLDPHQI